MGGFSCNIPFLGFCGLFLTEKPVFRQYTSTVLPLRITLPIYLSIRSLYVETPSSFISPYDNLMKCDGLRVSEWPKSLSFCG